MGLRGDKIGVVGDGGESGEGESVAGDDGPNWA